MKLKQVPEDFIVEEIPLKQPTGSGDFVWCRLRKRNWDLLKLLKFISAKLGISVNRIGYAGVKDKVAVSSQWISVKDMKTEGIKKINIEGVEISDFSYSDRPINLGDLSGNRFRITVRDLELDSSKLKSKIEKTKKVVNYFDSQRFGNRQVTHLVGKHIIEGNFEQAVWAYLTKTSKSENKNLRAIRKNVEKAKDLRQAARKFPKSLKWELAMVNRLLKREGDYIGALKALPPTLLKMFVNAYQSYLWNRIAAECTAKIKGNVVIPMIGYDTHLDSSFVGQTARKFMQMEKITTEDFRVQELPQIKAKGSLRDLYIFPKIFLIEVGRDELNKGKTKAVIEFTIQKGSYATEVVRQVFG